MYNVSTIFGIKDTGSIDFDEKIRKGFPFQMARKVQKALNISDSDFARFIGISMSTFRRLKTKKGRLSRLSSNQVYSLAALFAFAGDVLGNDKNARSWLTSHLISLGGRTPLEMAETCLGLDEVEGLLNSIRYGLPL